MSSLKEEVLPFSLSPQRHNLVHHVRQRQSASPSNDNSEILPDVADLKGQSTAVDENYSRLVFHPGREIDNKASQQHLSSPNEEAESYVNERANKYQGPSSTWTSRTASERASAGYLDQLKAKDLAAHLYNAHHLKRKAKWSDDEEAWSQGWKPSRYWTAWPLAPDMVPGVDDGPGWAGSDFQQPRLIRHMQQPQGQELLDVLVARVLSKAKKRNKDLRRHDGEATVFETELESLCKDDSAIYTEQESMNGFKPVVMRDDDIATNVLLPSVRHIMTQLDQLLMGLHYARDSYAYQSSLRPTRDPNSARPLKRGPQLKKSCRSTTSVSENDSVREGSSRPNLESSRDRSRLPPRKKPRGRIRTRMTQRDWGDVLGVASMTGWDSKSVSKAAYRCGTLFGEGIKFRKLEENGNDPIETTFLPGDSDYPDPDSTGNEEIAEEERTSSLTHDTFGNMKDSRWKFYCTVDWCRRSSHGFMDHNSAKRHFRRVHRGLNLPNWSQTTEMHELGQTDRPSSPPFSPSHDQEPVKIYCPVSSCRHYVEYINGNRGLRDRSGFADYRSFKRHMQKAHPDLEVPENPQVEEHGCEGEAENDAEMFGGVHVDGFLQPIKEAPWWTAPKRVRSSSRHSLRSKR
ncbi:hypothetical protein MMC31_000290 [Peltigera leucophlebia]|nr:hypothetical protein [Peltigera leucophlebia]